MKKILTSLLLPLFLISAPAQEEKRENDCNFFISGIQDEIDTWNTYFRQHNITIPEPYTPFSERCKAIYMQHLYQFAAEREHYDTDTLVEKIVPQIDKVFVHLNRYYSMLKLYGQACFRITENTPEHEYPQEYKAYLEIIENECTFLALNILKHCVWGAGDCYLIGNEDHYNGIEAWAKKYLAPIHTLPRPRTDATIARIAETLSDSAMTQFEINFSLHEPDKLQITQAFAYTNLLANIHQYLDSCPLSDELFYGKKVELDGSGLSALLIMQQDEWSNLLAYCYSEVFMPEWLTSYGTGGGVQTKEFVQQQLALLNYFSGNLFYEHGPETATAETDSEAEESQATSKEAVAAQPAAGSAINPAYLLPPLFIVFVWLMNSLLNRGSRKPQAGKELPGTGSLSEK